MAAIRYYPDSTQDPLYEPEPVNDRTVDVSLLSDVYRRCPECDKEIFRSVILFELRRTIGLFCTACDSEFQVGNTEEQRNAMSYKDGKCVLKEKLESFDELGIGDIYGLEISTFGHLYTHTALCYDINRVTKQALTVELFNVRGKNRVVKNTRDLGDEKLKKKNFFVYRYMPLDCLSLTKTRDRAKRTAESGDWPKDYSTSHNNCQHFTSWCKTGDKSSEDADRYGCDALVKLAAPCKLCTCKDNSEGWNPGLNSDWKSETLP